MRSKARTTQQTDGRTDAPRATQGPEPTVAKAKPTKEGPRKRLGLRAALATLLIGLLATTLVGQGLMAKAASLQAVNPQTSSQQAANRHAGSPQAASLQAPCAATQFVSLSSTPLPDEAIEPAPAEEADPTADESAETEDTASEIVISSAAVPLAAAPAQQPSSPFGFLFPSTPASPPSSADASVSPYSGYPSGAYNSEEYPQCDESGFIDTAESPLSTFSVDVDTASYTNLRRMVDSGYSQEDIPDGAVRIEEMLNYFHYSFIMPEPGEPFAVNAQVADCPWNPDTRLMVLGIQAQSADTLPYLGSNLVFLIDVSGSMEDPSKLPLLKESFSYLAEQLTDKDTISIVTYAGDSKTVLDGARGDDTATILDALESLQAGGCTNGEGGLTKAYALAQEHFIDGGNNRIILATDGDFNVGISSTKDLNTYVSNMRSTGVYLTVLGFGAGNYKDDKMETLADNGNGNYYYIDQISEAHKVFGTDLLSNLVCVANDVKIQVAFDPAYIAGYRLVGYDDRRLENEDFLDDTKDAAEMGAGHQCIVVYEIVMAHDGEGQPTEGEDEATTAQANDGVLDGADHVPEGVTKDSVAISEEGSGDDSVESVDRGGADDGEADTGDAWLTLSIRYKVPGQLVSKGAVFTLDGSAYTDDPDADWMFVSSIVEFGLVLTDSQYAGSSSLDDAFMRAVYSSGGLQERLEFVGLVKSLLI
ncbi:MAG: von Willebrand factor type A domain-containing protein [Eggerthellaceae bacterium]|nr:von Willebrand factor type A domain-containing protein [Eggerthellaceae bacterium]